MLRKLTFFKSILPLLKITFFCWKKAYIEQIIVPLQPFKYPNGSFTDIWEIINPGPPSSGELAANFGHFLHISPLEKRKTILCCSWWGLELTGAYKFFNCLIYVQKWFKSSQPPSYITTCVRHSLGKFTVASSRLVEKNTCRVKLSVSFFYLLLKKWGFVTKLNEFTPFHTSKGWESFLWLLGTIKPSLVFKKLFQVTDSKRMFTIIHYRWGDYF